MRLEVDGRWSLNDVVFLIFFPSDLDRPFLTAYVLLFYFTALKLDPRSAMTERSMILVLRVALSPSVLWQTRRCGLPADMILQKETNKI